MRVFVLFLVLLPSLVLTAKNDYKAIYLEPGDSIPYQPLTKQIGFFTSDLKIYCYRGREKSLSHIFQTVQLRLEIENDDFTQYEGETPDIVTEHYNTQKSIFSFSLLSTKKTLLKLNPFNQTCIGLETIQPYRLRLQLMKVDFWRVIQLAIGSFTFWFAAKLSQNALFYYLSGILMGIFASFLILIYLASKLVPRKPMMYGVLVGGWTVAIYFGQMLWENLQTIFVTYKTYVFWYVLITGFTSFIVCYRLGPPKNQRSRDIIKWGLQLASLVMIFYSSDYQEATAAFNIVVVLFYYFPRSWIYMVRSIYVRRFPPKLKLLTDAEYHEQGVRETTKALDELRNYCGSPECKQWRMMTKLKDPIRFASFMEGSSHILDEEILDYETSRADMTDSDLSEDNDDRDNNDDISEDEEYAGGTASSRILKVNEKNNYLRPNGSSFSASSSTPLANRGSRRSYQRDYSDDD